MVKLFGFLVVFAVCGNAAAQTSFQAYQGTFPIGGVPVNLLIVKPNVWPAGMTPSYSGWGASVPVIDPELGVQRRATGCVATLVEQPVAAGAVMTTVRLYVSASAPNGLGGAESTVYEAAPPISGNMTLNLVGANVWARFPASINLTPTTANSIP